MDTATPLPSAERLATLVSSVTTTMLGISFAPDERSQAEPLLVWRTALLPIPGRRPITVGLSSDREGCTALSGRLFSVERDEVDSGMINDSLCELVNMTAGLLKSALALDQALGLPRIVEQTSGATQATHNIVLRSSALGLVLWIHEGV